MTAAVAERLRRGPVRTVVTVLFLGAAATGIFLALRSQGWEVLGTLTRADAVPYLLAAFGAAVLALVLGMVSWRALVVDLGPPLGTWASARIFFVGMLGKYIPGRVWGLLAQVQMGRAAGVPGPVTTAAYLISLVVVLLTGFAVGLLVAPSLLRGQAVWLAVPVALTIVVLARPDLVNRCVTYLSVKARRPIETADATSSGLRRSIGAELAAWLVAGVHLWALAALFGAPVLASLPVCVGGFALATSVGGLAIVLPDGWGAREVVLTLALASVLPVGTAGVVAVASRLVNVVAELATIAVVVLMAKVAGGKGK
ncbi:lysylphosphatidylglycerol synthase domain-containing protein [Lentzea sp. NPDC092896]|uniref:lysylphosphatidylglycerol synthase domain-containing protein n=1 Tax=Lentzea sp. NPDC092896 TaxID=3364127 RepID=UPI003829668F